MHFPCLSSSADRIGVQFDKKNSHNCSRNDDDNWSGCFNIAVDIHSSNIKFAIYTYIFKALN